MRSIPKSRNPNGTAQDQHPSGARLSRAVALAALLLATAGAATVGGGTAEAASTGDAAAGQAMAERWCSSCHVVNGATATQAQSDAPSFSSIAAARGDELTPSWLAFRLLKPHPQMPSIDLSRQQALDLAAYFASLRK